MDELIQKILAERLAKDYSVKALALEVKDVDIPNRKVVGFLSSFDVLDSDRDVIRKGAFVKSIQENGPASNGNRKIAHLRNHDWDHQVGRFTELSETSFGLKFVSELGRSTKGNDALLDYQDGVLIEHSIGFNYVTDKIKFIDDTSFHPEGHWDISEVKLWEGSGVTFGANEFTPVIEAAKSGKIKEAYEKLFQLQSSFAKALKNGKGTDERLQALEARFKQIQTLTKSLMVQKPSPKDTSRHNEPTNKLTQIFLNS